MKAFFMNEVFELKHEIARLKEASLNVGNNFSEENLDTNLDIKFLFYNVKAPLLKLN